eukprot:4597-Prorocentrum_minimum.AAC.3
MRVRNRLVRRENIGPIPFSTMTEFYPRERRNAVKRCRVSYPRGYSASDGSIGRIYRRESAAGAAPHLTSGPN